MEASLIVLKHLIIKMAYIAQFKNLVYVTGAGGAELGPTDHCCHMNSCSFNMNFILFSTVAIIPPPPSTTHSTPPIGYH